MWLANIVFVFSSDLDNDNDDDDDNDYASNSGVLITINVQ